MKNKCQSPIKALWQSAYEMSLENRWQVKDNGNDINWFRLHALPMFIILTYRAVVALYECNYIDYLCSDPQKVTKIRFILWYLNRLDDRLLKRWRLTWIALQYFHYIIRPYRNFLEPLNDWFLRNASKLPGRKIYAIKFSRDCDMCESTRPVCYKNWFAYQYELLHIGDWAEGPVSIDIVSKGEYEDFTPTTRDRVMEAYENGNGTSIYV